MAKSPRSRPRSAKTTKAELEQALKRAVADLGREREAHRQTAAALHEAVDQQTATADILRAISSSPTATEPIYDAIMTSAIRLCDGQLSAVFRIDGDMIRLEAVRFDTPDERAELVAWMRSLFPIPLADARGLLAHVVATLTPVNVADIEQWPGVGRYTLDIAHRIGWRSVLVVPMLREAAVIGLIAVYRRDARRFGDDQVRLLQTFADQAVIAIENMRLFTELNQKNGALTEALDQQMATSEILRVISQSPTEIKPVFDAIVNSARRLLQGHSSSVWRLVEDEVHLVAFRSAEPQGDSALQTMRRRRIGVDGTELITTVIRERQPLFVSDYETDPRASEQLRAVARARGYRSILLVPLLRDGLCIGTIHVTRGEPGPFRDDEIGLLQTFAAQAVIAIENVRLFTELQDKNGALTESLEQQTATSDILRVISSSPTAVQPVLDAVAEAALRLCGGVDVVIMLRDADSLVMAGHHGVIPGLTLGIRRPLDRQSTVGRVVLDGRLRHIPDIDAVDPADEPYTREAAARDGFMASLTAPLLRDGAALGSIQLRRMERGPFAPRQIELLQTFADQAVIAIGNVRLFTELQEKNRALTDALDQQTATSEILRVISRSTTDVAPVFDAIVRSAIRLLRGHTGAVTRLVDGALHLVAFNATDPATDTLLTNNFPLPLTSPTSPHARAIRERTAVHITDTESDPRASERLRAVQRGRGRSLLVAPMLLPDSAAGAIAVTRQEAGGFSAEEVALLQTFADQAVIAIENVRLFTELQEKNRAVTQALDQQTATSEILRVISRSPTDVQPVLEAILHSAQRLIGAQIVTALRLIDGVVHRVAGTIAPDEETARAFPLPVSRMVARNAAAARVWMAAAVWHVTDTETDADITESGRALARARGYRSQLWVPMRRHREVVGVLSLTRQPIGGFRPDEIALLQTFADQAAIAIENVRLFEELEARTRDLTRSVDQLTALGEVSRAVSSTLDLDHVLNTVVLRASQLAAADGCSIFEYDEAADGFRMRATSQVEPSALDARRTVLVPAGEGAVGRLTETRAPVQIPDISSAEAYRSPLRDSLIAGGYRALLAVPMIQEDRVVGGLVVSRKAFGEFAAETVELLQTFANQSALAIANARLFREIEEKSAQLQVANQHKSEFLANMSHELRTPLNAVIGFSDVLLEGMFGEINEKQAEYLRDILSSGKHLLSLINDILDLSKIEAGRMELDLSDFDAPQAIADALLLMRERATRQGIAWGQVMDERLGQITADERKFKQVLLNLLSNAVKFTPAGGKVEVRARLVDSMVEVAVADTGEGIAPEDQATVFEEFRQVGKSSKKVEGTGLGLALCRKFVELHGGTIALESQVGVGSTFTFTLPVRTIAATSPA